MGFCEVEDCENSAKYFIEWYGLNQYGENPVVVDEIDVCEFHLVKSSVHPDYGGVPDNIGDIEPEKDRPDLLEEIVKKLSG